MREKNKQKEINTFLESRPYAIAKGAVGGNIQTTLLITRNLPNVLKLACLLAPDNGILHVDEDGNERMQTNTELMQDAKCVLAGLRDKGLKPGDKVVLQVDDQPSFLVAFWGATLGGFVTVPLPVPGGFPTSEGMERVSKVCAILDKFYLVTDQEKEKYKAFGEARVFNLTELKKYSPDKKIYRPKSKDTAILLFSSGSTGDPKGVILTHKNIMCEIETGSMSFSDVPSGDYRTSMMGYPCYVMRRKLFNNNGPGIFSRSVSRLVDSSFGRLLAKIKPGKYFLDTLSILSGKIISVNLDMTWDDIIMANWMPYSHVMGLIGLHVGPTALGFSQVALKTNIFSENPALLLKLIDRYRISYLPCPNFAVQWLTTQVSEEDIKGIDLSCIKMLGNTSEPISPIVTGKFIDKFSKFGFKPEAMCFGYGMSEATAEITFPHLFEKSTFHKVDKDLFFKEKVILPASSKDDGIELAELGAPVQCMNVKIVDDNDELVREHMVGHIQIKGPTVLQGYYNNPSANENLFCDGWLRTGDMGFLINGRLVLTGRQKDIIIINGQNLYAHDIENQIKKIPGLEFNEFAITGLKDYDTDLEKIVLFINIDESREALSAMLARINKTMITSMGVKIDYLVPVNEIPRTPTAKIKRFKLREQFEHNKFENIITSDHATSFMESTKELKDETLNKTEKTLVNIWKDVTEKENISKFDNFFDLGGNSLMATKIVSRVREDMGINIPIRTIFEHQTLDTFATAVESMMVSKGKSAFPPIEPLKHEAFYDVSHAQKRLWYLDQVIPNSSFFNIPGAVIIENMAFDHALLEKAFQEVIKRHENLRTTFHTIDNKPVQKIADFLASPILFIDLSSDNNQDKKLKSIIEDEKAKSFNLTKGPLLRASIVKLSQTKHAFIIILHHIISDGWSMGLLVQEAMHNYFAFQAGEPSPLPELRIQYKEFSHWQNQIIQSKEMKNQENYWKDKLHGDLPVLDLPTDRPRPAVQSHNGATLKMDIGRNLSGQLKDLARSLNVTPFMLTLALFKVLLHKMTGQEDIIVGSPIANRTNKDIEPLIGFFVNMLPLRSSLFGNPKFKDFLDEVKQTSLSAYANQDFPFDKLVEVINPVRDMSRSPVFDIVFEYRDVFVDTFNINMNEVSVKDITGDDPIAKFDMFATFSQGKDNIIMQFEYNRDLFENDSIKRMMGYFVNLIKEVIHDPIKHISDIDILGQEEMAQILTQFNKTDLDVPTDTCMHTLFEEVEQRHPKRPAVVFEGEETSYEELNKRANQLARFFIHKGMKDGDIIGILMNRSFEMIVSQLAAWKAGGAFVPIDPDYPSERITYLIEDSGSKILVTQKEHTHNISLSIDNIVCLDEESGDIGKFPVTPPEVVAGADNLAYIIYTSGSTGRPKGSQIIHRNLVNLCFWHNHDFKIDETDRASHLAGVSFDATVWELWPYLIAGSCVVPLEKILSEMMPQDLVTWLEKNRITRSFIPTKLAEVVLNTDLSGLNLKTLLTGGDRLSFIPSYQKFDVINNYGPTETTVVATSTDVSNWDNAKGSPPIGKPVSNVNIYILDNYLKPVPIGVIGELYIGGASVGKGYLNNPDKTKQAFIPNPFSEEDDFLYKTGDFVRWLPDGNVDFMGRKDFQVEIRGYRVEIGEIEVVLSGFDRIRECVVIDKTDDKGSTRLIGFHVSEELFDETQCHAYLKKQLPAYMIPSRLIRLDKLPMTPNGKLDRRALSSMVDDHLSSAVTYVAPGDDIEKALSEVWQDVLNVKKVGVNDNFFDLGGDSIISLQVVTKLSHKGYSIHPKDILQYQTISELSPVVEVAAIVEADQGSVTGTSPLAPVQRWFFDQGFLNENQFNQALLFKSSIRIDEKMLGLSLKAVMDHHDVLRASFGKSIHEFHPSMEDVCLVVKKIEKEEDLEKEVKAIQGSFDISNGPLFGVGLFQMKEKDYLLLAGHHLVVDGVSWRILMEDLLTGYSAALGGIEIVFPPKTTSFKEWATRLDTYATDSEFKDEVMFWEDMLLVDIPELTVDHDNGPNIVGSTDTIRMEFDKEKTDQLLKEVHKSYNTEVNDILLTALMQAQAQWTEHDDVMFNLEGHGREDILDDVDISRTVGWFTSIYPVVLSVDQNEELSSQIIYVKEKLRSIPHKGFNFNVLKYWGHFKPSIHPEIRFNYLGQVTFNDMGEQIDAPGIMDEQNIREVFIDIICIVIDGRLRMDFVFSKNLYNSESIELFADLFKEKLSMLIEHCLDPESFDITPSDFELADIDQDILDKISDFE